MCRKLQIPHPGRGYWAKRAVGQPVEHVPRNVGSVETILEIAHPRLLEALQNGILSVVPAILLFSICWSYRLERSSEH